MTIALPSNLVHLKAQWNGRLLFILFINFLTSDNPLDDFQILPNDVAMFSEVKQILMKYV